MGNPEAQKRVDILFKILETNANLKENMTVDELKIQIGLSCGSCERVSDRDVCYAVKRMKNKDWRKLSERINKHLRWQ